MADIHDFEKQVPKARWSWRRKLLAVIISCVLALLAAEAGLRIVGYGPLYVNPEQRIFWQYHPQLGWHHRPGQEGHFRKRQFDTQVRINSRGLRDKEYPLARQKGVRRILVLGDSFTWGFGVEQEEVFTEVVESRLGDVDVINAGVSGYSPDQELLWLQDEGVRYRPDLVLLALSGNDVWGNHQRVISFVYGKPLFQLDSNGGLVLENVPVPTPRFSVRVRHALRQRSSVAQLLISSLERWRYQGKVDSGDPAAGAPTTRQPQAEQRPFPLTLAIIDRMKAVANHHGARFAIVTNSIYWAPWPDGDYDDFVMRLTSAGYPLLDVDSLDGYEKRSLQIPGDRHWNVDGHRFVGEAIEQWITSEQLLPLLSDG